MYTLIYYLVCVCTPQHMCGGWRKTFRSWFPSSTMWVWELNSGPQAWWQTPFPAEPSHWPLCPHPYYCCCRGSSWLRNARLVDEERDMQQVHSMLFKLAFTEHNFNSLSYYWLKAEKRSKRSSLEKKGQLLVLAPGCYGSVYAASVFLPILCHTSLRSCHLQVTHLCYFSHLSLAPISVSHTGPQTTL